MLNQAIKQAVLRPKRRHFLDTFATLSPRWVVQGGTLAVDTGALKAATIADWGPNLVSNGEFTTNTTGWSALGGATLTRRDFAAYPGGSPIAPTGGSNNYGLEVLTDGTATSRASWNIAYLLGAYYHATARGYRPAGVSATMRLFSSQLDSTSSAVDAWTTLGAVYVPILSTTVLDVRAVSGSPSDVVYYDAIAAYRQNAAAVALFAPNFRTRLVHISPAAAVTPFGWIFRRTDNLNYWELRIIPNTAGNDMQIVQVTAGVGTVRAEADVDWTADQNDEVLLIAQGPNITTTYKKSGASVWTAGPSYAAATQGITSPYQGPLLYGTARRLAEVELWS